MSFERTLLKELRIGRQRSEINVEFTAERVSPMTETLEKRKPFKLSILPLLTVVILLLLFVTIYALYTLLSREAPSMTRSDRNIKSQFSYPGCGKVQCGGLKCSHRTRRLVGGKQASRGAWPWMAQIQVDYRHACAGTLINKNHVLTAAHCLYINSKPISEKRLAVTLGLYNRMLPESSRQQFTVCNVMIHDKFNRDTLEHDLAIIKLTKDATLDDYVWPACLSIKRSTHFDDIDGYMLGWGKEKVSASLSPVLKQANVPVVSYKTCSRQNNKIYRMVKVDKNFNTCVGYGSKKIDYACDGDSGGGFFQEESSTWYVNGIISWVDPICNSSTRNTYTVLTRVFYYEQWIGVNMDLPFLQP